MANMNFYFGILIWTAAVAYAQQNEYYDARLDYSCDPVNSQCDQVLRDLKAQALDSMAALGAIDDSKCTKVDHGAKTACNVTSRKEPTRPPPNNVLYCGTVKFQVNFMSNIDDREHTKLEGQFQAELKWSSGSAQTSRALQPLGSQDVTNLEPGKQITLPEFYDFFPVDFYDEKLRGVEYRVAVTYYYTRDGACAIEAAPAPGGAGGMNAVPVLIALMYIFVKAFL